MVNSVHSYLLFSVQFSLAVTIAWTIASYDENTVADYTATGVLTLPTGWTGTASDVTAIVVVC